MKADTRKRLFQTLQVKKQEKNRSSIFEWIKWRDYLALVLILTARLNGAVGLVPKRKLFERVNAGNGLV